MGRMAGSVTPASRWAATRLRQRLEVADRAQALHEAIAARSRARRAVVGGELGAEAALLEHGAVEGQGQVARQLALEEPRGRGAIHGDGRRHRGHDLEAVERLAGPRAPAADRGHRLLAHVRRAREPEHDAVGDLAGELEHRGPRPARSIGGGAGSPGRRSATRRDSARPRSARLPVERRPEHRTYSRITSSGRPMSRPSAPSTIGPMAHADAEAEGAARELRERQRLLGEQHGMARIDRDDARARARCAGAACAYADSTRKPSRPEAVGHPDAVVAERPPRGARGRRAARDRRRGIRKSAVRGMAISARRHAEGTSWARRSSPLSRRNSTAGMPTSPGRFHVRVVVVDEEALARREASRSAAESKTAGSGLAMPTSAEQTMSSKR